MILAAAFLATPSHGHDMDGSTTTVLAVVHRLDSALMAKDARELGELLEPDFIGTVPSGVALPRDAYIGFHTRPYEGLLAIETAAGTRPTVRVFDDQFAVVNRRVSVRRADAAQTTELFEVQRIEVLRQTNGQWKFVSGQGTRVQP
jgi:hypothetical protein